MDICDQADEIAIVGMSCRLPGARDTTEYWRNLYAGVESIDVFSPDDLAASGMPRELLSDPSFVPAFGTLSDAFAFDAAFFRVSQNEARVMDPQQRVFLECAWSALEDAGYDPSRCAGAIGVFAGSGVNGHHARILAHPELLSAVGDEVALLANNRDFLCAGVSYRLGLRGPSLVIQTACSTSLVAVHVGVSEPVQSRVRSRAGRRRVDRGRSDQRLSLSGRRHPLARRPLPRVRCVRHRHRPRIRRRHRRVEAPRGCAARWRHDPRGREGIGDQQRWRREDRVHGAERERPGQRHLRSAGRRQSRSLGYFLHRDARHRHAAWRSDRDRRAPRRVRLTRRASASPWARSRPTSATSIRRPASRD